MHIAGLGARGRIGNRGAVLQDVAIARAGAAIRLGFEPAVIAWRHRQRGAALDRERDIALRRRPEAKSGPAGSNEVRAERQAPIAERLIAAAFPVSA